MEVLQKQLAMEQPGSGAIAQNGGMAAGERGAAVGTNQGNLAIGDHVRQIRVEQYVETMVNQILEDPCRSNRGSLRLAYLYRLCEQTKALSLSGMGQQGSRGTIISGCSLHRLAHATAGNAGAALYFAASGSWAGAR